MGQVLPPQLPHPDSIQRVAERVAQLTAQGAAERDRHGARRCAASSSACSPLGHPRCMPQAPAARPRGHIAVRCCVGGQPVGTSELVANLLWGRVAPLLLSSLT